MWCLPTCPGSRTVLWCTEDYRDCRYSPALRANRGQLTSIVALIGITYHRRSYKITSPNVSRYIKWLQILPDILKVVRRKVKSMRSYQIHNVSVTAWFDFSITWPLKPILSNSPLMSEPPTGLRMHQSRNFHHIKAHFCYCFWQACFQQ